MSGRASKLCDTAVSKRSKHASQHHWRGQRETWGEFEACGQAHLAAAAAPPASAGAWCLRAQEAAGRQANPGKGLRAVQPRPPPPGQHCQARQGSAASPLALLRHRCSERRARWAALPWQRQAAMRGSTRRQHSGCLCSWGRTQLPCARLRPKDQQSGSIMHVSARAEGSRTWVMSCLPATSAQPGP